MTFVSCRLGVILILATLVAAPGVGTAVAFENEMSQRFQYGLSWQARPKLGFKGKLQGRFRQGLGDFYYLESDLGVEYRPHDRFRLPVAFRYQQKESDQDWQARRYILFDPTWRFLSLGAWDFDFRPRFQLKGEDFGAAYIRPLVNVAYNFNLSDHKARWWIYEEYYFQFDRELRDDFHNPNNFSTGVSWSLSRITDIYLYYMVYSYRPREQAAWTHIHQPCLALSMKL